MPNTQDSIVETEQQLVETAQCAVSQSNWVVGECASKWTKKYARGRTDADFGQLVGLTGDQIYQRRRVWETFADVDGDFVDLKWSHFYVALNWDDAPECLQWAQENEASVAEMRAWRRAMHGEDLSQQATDDWGNELTLEIEHPQATEVKDPDDFAAPGTNPNNPASSQSTTEQNRVASAAREDYSPFRKGAASPPPKPGSEAPVAVLEKPKRKPALRRLVTTLERANKSLTKEVLKEDDKDADKLLKRLRAVVADLAAKLAEF